MFQQIAAAIRHIHEHNILHRYTRRLCQTDKELQSLLHKYMYLNFEGNVTYLTFEGNVTYLSFEGNVMHLNFEGNVMYLNFEGNVITKALDS